jgi:hypothetical protein
MAKNATQAIKMLARIGFNLESISTPPNMVYKVLHKARPLIYLPLAAVDNNVQFMLDTSQKFIQTTDGMVLEVQRADVVNIITAKDEIEQQYRMPWYQFAEKWNKTMNPLRQLDFFRIEIKQQQPQNNA